MYHFVEMRRGARRKPAIVATSKREAHIYADVRNTLAERHGGWTAHVIALPGLRSYLDREGKRRQRVNINDL